MLKVGLTGGIGSGKTTAAGIFAQLGIPVFYADDVAKSLADNHPEVREKIIRAFGATAYAGERLNRAYLAQLVFNNDYARQTINGIIHPAVAQAFETWASQQHSAYVLQEAAILFETGSYKRFDKNILVYAPTEVRIARAMKRSGMTRGEVLARMAQQGNPDEHRKLADYIIENDGEHMLLPQIMQIHAWLIER